METETKKKSLADWLLILGGLIISIPALVGIVSFLIFLLKSLPFEKIDSPSLGYVFYSLWLFAGSLPVAFLFFLGGASIKFFENRKNKQIN